MAAGAFALDLASFRRAGQGMLQGDVLLALGVVTILVVLILPLPPLLLDLMLALSITLSVLVLLTALLIERPLDLNVFPTILLITTMLRSPRLPRIRARLPRSRLAIRDRSAAAPALRRSRPPPGRASASARWMASRLLPWWRSSRSSRARRCPRVTHAACAQTNVALPTFGPAPRS